MRTELTNRSLVFRVPGETMTGPAHWTFCALGQAERGRRGKERDQVCVQITLKFWPTWLLGIFFLNNAIYKLLFEQLMKSYNKYICGWLGLAVKGKSGLFLKMPSRLLDSFRNASCKLLTTQLSPNWSSFLSLSWWLGGIFLKSLLC